MTTKGKHTAIDSETIEGKPILICTPKRALWYPKSFSEIARFLTTTKRHEGHHIWTFNLTYDATGFLKFLPYENLKEIYETNETEFEDYHIFFIPGKLFSVTKNKDKATLVDAQQFFQSSLEKAGQNFLNEGKSESPESAFFKDQDGKSPEELHKFAEEHKQILEIYCKKDADLTARLGQKIDQSCFDTYGFQIETYSSNAKLGEKATLLHCGQISTDKMEKQPKYKSQIPYAYPQIFENSRPLQYALLSYRGGIFETWKRGSFGKVTDLDINSAYPFQMSKLPHWGNGSFVELTPEMIDDIETGKVNYEYGWIGCNFDCSYIPYDSKQKETFPFIYNDTEVIAEAPYHKIYFPDGMREQVITLLEYQFMREYGYKANILCGFVWIRKEGKEGTKYKNPFSWIPPIYDYKLEIKKTKGKEAKKDMNYLQCKIGMNGAYGKCVQKIGTNRTLYNPFYGSYITAGCRMQIARFIKNNKMDPYVINIATDGILLEGDHNFNSSEKLGEFEVNHYNNALILGNGMLQLNEGKDTSSRLRGITQDQHFDVKTLLMQIKDKNEYVFGKRRPLKMGEALLHCKIFTIEDMNKFIKFERKIRLNADTKRKWPELKSFEELLNNKYDGKKWTVAEIEAMKPIKKLNDTDKAIKELDERIKKATEMLKY